MTLLEALTSPHTAFAECGRHGLYPVPERADRASRASCPECGSAPFANLTGGSSIEGNSSVAVTR